MPEITVTRDELDAELKRIERSGEERIVSILTRDDGFVIRTETLAEPPMERR